MTSDLSGGVYRGLTDDGTRGLTCLMGYMEPIVFRELNLGQLVISIGSSRNWRPL